MCFFGVWSWTCQSKPPGRRNQAQSALEGFGGGHARANPREEEIRLKVLRRGLEVDMPEQTPGKKKSESASAGFGGGHARANPREEEIRLKVLRRGLEVDMPEQTPGKKKSESASAGFGAGHASANPREEEIRLKVLRRGLELDMPQSKPPGRLKVLRRGLEVDMPETTPGKKKSGSKCFGGVWRWTCQSKPPGRRNQAESVSAGFGGGHARANPREEEI